MRKSSKILISAAVVVGLLGSGGAAFAWWSSVNNGGTGAASTIATATNAVTVTQSSVINDLAPGLTRTLAGTNVVRH